MQRIALQQAMVFCLTQRLLENRDLCPPMYGTYVLVPNVIESHRSANNQLLCLHFGYKMTTEYILICGFHTDGSQRFFQLIPRACFAHAQGILGVYAKPPGSTIKSATSSNAHATILIIGHNPRLQNSQAEAEKAFFFEYLEKYPARPTNGTVLIPDELAERGV